MLSVAGIKYWDNPEYKAFDVGDYVQADLIWNYNGICNQGTNVAHSTTATNWVNLGSAGRVNDVFVQRLNAAGTDWETAANLNPVGERNPGHWTDNGFRSGTVVPVAGYYTETLVNGEWTNRKWHSGTTYSYEEGTSPACVRLTWGPLPDGMMLLVR